MIGHNDNGFIQFTQDLVDGVELPAPSTIIHLVHNYIKEHFGQNDRFCLLQYDDDDTNRLQTKCCVWWPPSQREKLKDPFAEVYEEEAEEHEQRRIEEKYKIHPILSKQNPQDPPTQEAVAHTLNIIHELEDENGPDFTNVDDLANKELDWDGDTDIAHIVYETIGIRIFRYFRNGEFHDWPDEIAFIPWHSGDFFGYLNQALNNPPSDGGPNQKGPTAK